MVVAEPQQQPQQQQAPLQQQVGQAEERRQSGGFIANGVKVVGSFLATGPAGLVWAFRSIKKDQGEGVPPSLEPRATLPGHATLRVRPTSLIPAATFQDNFCLVLQVGDVCQKSPPFSAANLRQLPFTDDAQLPLPPTTAENLIVTVEKQQHSVGVKPLAKGYVHLPSALGRAGPNVVAVYLVDSLYGNPFGTLYLSIEMRLAQQQNGVAQNEQALAIGPNSTPSLAILDKDRVEQSQHP